MQWYLAASGGGAQEVSALCPSVSCPILSHLFSACPLFYSRLLTHVNRWSIQRQRLHSGRTAPRLFICSHICRQVWSVLPAPVWTADNRCLPSFSPRSLMITYLSPSPFRWHEFPGPPVLQEIFLHLVHKAISDPKTNNKYNASCWAGYVLPNVYGYDNFLWAKSFFFYSSIAQKIDMQRT